MGGNGHEYHFKHRTLPHARSRRSITHTRLLKSHPMVSIDIISHENNTMPGGGIIFSKKNITAQTMHIGIL